MRNIKLTLGYDGTEFNGWQIQPGRRTIQGTLLEVVERVTDSRTIVHGAGRTDAGVHALGQVANFHTASRLPPSEFRRAFNALLPPAIRVVEAEEVEPRFHSRWDALAKTYQYRIFRGPIRGPFHRFYTFHYPFPLDADAIAQAARLFEGVHDFSSFAAAAGTERDGREANPLREIFRSELVRCPSPSFSFAPPARPGPSGCEDEMIYIVRGKSFLRHMVRKLVGTLLEVGRGRLSLDDVRGLFDVRDRARSGPTAPPQGLCLISVEYPEPWRIDAG
ncbi:MAG TPA: tRNA pseudouridine(38-40) synthase TruA [Candidatus Dormibacteraeota bacterium]|nr:tRNA pseudouridine(38-40) synthase TruA [Candidatus Dormibacteraeota bacterium]